MAVQTVFKRYELKYLMTREQQKLLLKIMDGHMALDKYGHTAIRNIYFDTDNYRLVRHSIEGPPYKEKLRIRSYSHVSGNDNVFVELKKKYKSVVYKRRLVLPLDETMEALTMHRPLPSSSQIADEINYFCSYYRTLRPAVFLSYEREAFYSTDGSDFRVTFDENILYRDEDISLSGEIYGTPIIEKNQVLMEIKTPGGIPMWITDFLTGQRIYKTSFSKYGAAYKDMVLNNKCVYGFNHDTVLNSLLSPAYCTANAVN